jgi:hypothetical protein
MSRNSAPGAGIDGSEGEDFLNRGKDDGNKPARDISTREFKQACNPWDEPTWKPGPVKQGNSPPRYAPKGDAGTKSPEAYEPSGKYAKKPGRAGNQRSGA